MHSVCVCVYVWPACDQLYSETAGHEGGQRREGEREERADVDIRPRITLRHQHGPPTIMWSCIIVIPADRYWQCPNFLIFYSPVFTLQTSPPVLSLPVESSIPSSSLSMVIGEAAFWPWLLYSLLLNWSTTRCATPFPRDKISRIHG